MTDTISLHLNLTVDQTELLNDVMIFYVDEGPGWKSTELSTLSALIKLEIDKALKGIKP